ncbi:hypothetical protein [Nocardia huaxiensis]|uniref:ABM domain-containing protein n=1 Tax=Nocardia huaxiensis TaxID=2755382 RepID=A0A7D6VIK8_9NOCA|nr:hypothetical protein [Nocardia huaxiensis]QLY33735.1 hypothetical protein H0264_17190 [Nocardia huaxiensis]UFS99340.1 hypothetical protein LPY97_16330 [Nocardia huaxiensis]
MTFVRLAFFPGGTEAHYRAIGDALGEYAPPAGRILFTAGPVEGGWQVVQVWERKDQLDAFNQAVFFPAVASLGGGGFPQPPRVTDFDAADLLIAGS